MNQQSRTVLAVALSVLVIVIYSLMAPKTAPESSAPPFPKIPDMTSRPLVTPPTVAPTPVAAIDNTETQALAQDIPIETSKAHLTLSTRGGLITRYELKDYRYTTEKKSPLKDLIKESPGSWALFLGVREHPELDETKVFAVVSDSEKDGQRQIMLAWQNAAFRLEKTFTFGNKNTDYALGVSYALTNLSPEARPLTAYLKNKVLQKPMPEESGFLRFLKMQQPDIYWPEFFQNDALTTNMNWQALANTTTMGIDWAGISDRYFLMALIPQTALAKTANLGIARDGDFIVNDVSYPQILLSSGQSTQARFKAYLGPKKLGEMESLGVKLEKSIDYGWFSVLAMPILWLMTLLHKIIPNWGLVIIALTFVIKILLHPVNKKSMDSMKGMQQLQPKLQEIKKRYPGDSKKQNEEIMQLFKTHKVNPMSGCLPMILQMPIYIVLYKVLWNAIELYHAPFFGFYHDLSAPDPYFIAPILLGIFMVLQQKLTPSPTTDPAQQKMMMFMPIMFTGLMLFLPVGLVVYIFMNTFMSVIQQYMLRKEISFWDLVRGKHKFKVA